MTFQTFLKKERKIWHDHFIPSLVAGLAVAIIAFLLEATVTNVILFASVGASAIILTNSKSHQLTKLHTTILAYLIAIIIALVVFGINLFIPMHLAINAFLLVFVSGIILYLADTVHPPAVSASLAFIILDRPVSNLLFLFLSIIALLVVIRLITYLASQHLSLRSFWQEFRKSFA